ncbi:MAG: lamin tail domain-containing protein [Bacteroidota bacterium]
MQFIRSVLICLICTLALPLAAQTESISNLIINEFLADPPPGLAGDANGDGSRVYQEDEFIEFINAGDSSLDISGYKLFDSQNGQTLRHIFPANTILAPYQVLLLFGRPSTGGNLGDFGQAIVQNASQSSVGNGDGLSLTNGGDNIVLKSPSDSTIFSFQYTAAEIDQSLTRNPDITGETVDIPHTTASNAGLLFSPGRTVEGNTFAIRTVGFKNAQSRISEDEGSINLILALEGQSPIPDSQITVEVHLISGNSQDIGGFSMQTVTFPAGSDMEQSLQISLTNDSLIEEEELFVFELDNLTSNDPAVSSPENSQFELSIVDNDAILEAGFSSESSEVKAYRQVADIPVQLSGMNFNSPIEIEVSLSNGNSSLIDNFSSDTLTFTPMTGLSQSLVIEMSQGVVINQEESFEFSLSVLSGSNINGVAVEGLQLSHRLTILPNTGSHYFYVDALNGDDTNDGRTPETAWETLIMINFYPEFPPSSRILLRAGSYWQGNLRTRGSGNGLDSVNIIDRYGKGPRPIIDGNGLVGEGVVKLLNQEYWEISGLELTNSAPSQGDRKGIEVRANDFGIVNHIHLKDLHIHDISGIPSSDNSGKRTGGIYITTGGDDFVDTRYDDILIENCIIHDCENQGIVTNNESGVSFRPDDPNFERRRYTNLRIRNNVIYNISKNAMIIRLTDGGLIEHNLCYNTALDGITGNTMFCRTTRNTTFQFNEGYGNQSPAHDGSMYDSDLSNFGPVFQYSYSHDNNHGLIWYAAEPHDRDIIVRYNISQNDKGRLIAMRQHFVNTSFYNNVFYIGPHVSPIIIHERSGKQFSYQFFNNIVYNLSPTARYEINSTATRDIDNNLFFGFQPSTQPADANMIQSDPLFVNPGKATFGLHSLDGYKLLQNSPALHAGRIIPDNGGRDYFGHYVAPDKAPHIGAYNGPGLDANSTAPFLQTNLGLSLMGDSVEGIDQTLLEARDPDHEAETLIYHLLRLPASGQLLLQGTALSLMDTFRQSDIDAGLLAYENVFDGNIGDYFAFEVEDPDGQKTDSSVFVFHLMNSTSNDLVSPDVECTIFPNPTSGLFQLEIHGSYIGEVQAQVLDFQGKKLKSLSLKKTQAHWQTSFNLEGLSPGIYFLRLQLGQHVLSKHIILKEG